jgi:alkylation response protein AidB-like acyl-CoA dehydrogenase
VTVQRLLGRTGATNATKINVPVPSPPYAECQSRQNGRRIATCPGPGSGKPVAPHVIAEARRGAMQFTFTPEQQRFRSQIRDFLDDELPRARKRGEMTPGRVRAYSQPFSKALAARRWIGLSWPEQFGGANADAMSQVIFTEEMITSEAPCGYHFIAERQIGPSLMRHGTPEQREFWIPRILDADVSFCLGLSEPGAGSDLANVRTRAQRRGDVYVVNGSKIWTSHAHLSDAIWLVVRTNPDVPRHKGISILLVDLKSPGVEIRPLLDLTGDRHFNEIFFDDVEVPVTNRVGEEDRGWYVLAEHLDFERSGIEMLLEGRAWLERTLHPLRQRRDTLPLNPRWRAEAAQLWTEMEVGRMLCYRIAWQQANGCVPNHEAAMSKLFGSEWIQRVAQFALQVGSRAGESGRLDGGFEPADRYLYSVSRTIAGGTSEVQRNVIATRGLSLPR